MTIPENDRLDLRQAFAELMDERLAGIAMQAMPPLDYNSFATKQDLGILEANLRTEVADLRSEVRSDIAGIRTDLANTVRLIVAAQVATMMMLGAWVAAIT